MSEARPPTSPIADILGRPRVENGSTDRVALPVTTDLDGATITVQAHVIRGPTAGPTVGLFGVQHGNEWRDIEVFRSLLTKLAPGALAGTVILVPVSNPVALGSGTRITQSEADSPDLNRAWSGGQTWLADAIARTLDREVLACCDAALDFHPGPWGVSLGLVGYGTDFPDPAITAASRTLALAFGYPLVRAGRAVAVFPGARSLMAHAGLRRGIPAINVDLGGSGFGADLERDWTDTTVTGILNVLRSRRMLDGDLTPLDSFLQFESAHRINPNSGGLLVPTRDPDALGREVHAGEVLAEVISPYSLTTLETLRAPADGWLVYLSRTRPVRPGDWGFGVVSKHASDRQRVEETERWADPPRARA